MLSRSFALETTLERVFMPLIDSHSMYDAAVCGRYSSCGSASSWVPEIVWKSFHQRLAPSRRSTHARYSGVIQSSPSKSGSSFRRYCSRRHRHWSRFVCI